MPRPERPGGRPGWGRCVEAESGALDPLLVDRRVVGCWSRVGEVPTLCRWRPSPRPVRLVWVWYAVIRPARSRNARRSRREGGGGGDCTCTIAQPRLSTESGRRRTSPSARLFFPESRPSRAIARTARRARHQRARSAPSRSSSSKASSTASDGDSARTPRLLAVTTFGRSLVSIAAPCRAISRSRASTHRRRIGSGTGEC